MMANYLHHFQVKWGPYMNKHEFLKNYIIQNAKCGPQISLGDQIKPVCSVYCILIRDENKRSKPKWINKQWLVT